jgi:hypothetical protein
MVRFGPARLGNAAIVAAVLTVVTLTFVVFLFEAEGNTSNAPVGVGQRPVSAVTSDVAAQPSGCQPPASVTPGLTGGSMGPIPFSFVGTNTTCIVVTRSTTGPSMAEFSYALDAQKPLLMTMSIDANGNGTSTVPNGTNFTVTVGSKTFPVYTTLQIKPSLFALPAGNTTFSFQVSVPSSYEAGAYHFNVVLFAWQDSSESQGAGSSVFPVNLDAQ